MIFRYKRFFILLLYSLLPLVVFPQTRSLDYYLNEGIRNSPLLRDLQNRLNTTSFDTLLLQAANKPQIEAVSQLLYSPVYGKFGYDEVITDGGNYQAVAAVSKSIFNRKEIENKYKAIGIKSQSVRNSAKLTVAEMKKAITNQFLTCCSDFSELSFNRSFFELMQSENEIVKQFVNNGICNQTDYLSLIVETQGQEELKGMREVKAQLEKQLATSKQLTTSLKAQLETGIIQMTDYLNSIKNFRNINRNLNLVRIQILQIINEMNYLATL